MLSKVLKKESCANCRFCCSFRRCSLWETPLFSMKSCNKLGADNEYGVRADFEIITKCPENAAASYGQMQLMYKYQTEDSEEEAVCEFLDAKKGCVLSDADKPFDCKIWPLRIMKKEDALVIALTPTCPALGTEPSQELRDLVLHGLGQQIFDYAKAHPFIVKEYKEGFPIIMNG